MDGIRFSSKAAPNVTMERQLALRLIDMMGHSGSVPGAILAEDLEPALETLRQRLSVAAAEEAQSKLGGDGDDDDGEQEIRLSTRAFPLIQLLQAADKKKQNLTWERFTGVYI